MSPVIALAFLTFLAVPASGQEKLAASAQALQARTVYAFVGTWTLEGTLSRTGAKEASTVRATYDCKRSAAGRVALCTGKGTATGIGEVEDVALITWDAEARGVRYVGMSSMGEVHDHRCAWKDDKTLQCDPLSVTLQGQPATVDLTIQFVGPKGVTLNETTTLQDGSKITFEAKADGA